MVDEVREFCRRVLGDTPAAGEAAAAALSDSAATRVVALGRAARECLQRLELAPESTDDPEPPSAAGGSGGASLAEAVAFEIAAANLTLPGRQRAVLALRELLALSYAEIGLAMALEDAAVGSLVARSRLALRDELRGAMADAGEPCAERERAFRLLARRQDSEPLDSEEDDWILGHMAQCSECEQSHAAMLEASVCYRAWRPAP